MKHAKKLAGIIIFASFFVLVVSSYTKPHTGYIHPLSIGDTTLMTQYARTDREQEQGLSGTRTLAPNTGMLFIFPRDTTVSFWMKDMRYPIDIIWIGADKKVVDIHQDISPDTYPETFSAHVPFRYVLEVPAGFSATHAVSRGAEVVF